jgi:hypothetical protein
MMSPELCSGGYSMLVRAYAFVHVPGELVCARIVADHSEWLSPMAAGAAREGDALRLRIGAIESLPMLGKTVTVRVGEPLARDEITVVPITWQATGSPGLFPVLTADLEIAGVGLGFTRLTLRGHYDPPLGALGRRIDRLTLHRLAEATIRSFMRRVADSLTATVANEKD